MTTEENSGSFWDHLDILRSVIIRIITVWGIFSMVAFVFKERLFDIVLAPSDKGFILYGLLDTICAKFGFEYPEPTNVRLINTGLAQQFLIHVQTAMCTGLILTAPYALYESFRFVSPGLYIHERRHAVSLITGGCLMFYIGLALSYFIIFPLTFQFLGSYQVSMEVINMISLDSYISTLMILGLCMGIVCELPILAWIGAKAGLLRANHMTKYRRHSIVAILVIAAIITPTSDIFTLLIVSIPIWLLYEFSILLVKQTQKPITSEEQQ